MGHYFFGLFCSASQIESNKQQKAVHRCRSTLSVMTTTSVPLLHAPQKKKKENTNDSTFSALPSNCLSFFFLYPPFQMWEHIEAEKRRKKKNSDYHWSTRLSSFFLFFFSSSFPRMNNLTLEKQSSATSTLYIYIYIFFFFSFNFIFRLQQYLRS